MFKDELLRLARITVETARRLANASRFVRFCRQVRSRIHFRCRPRSTGALRKIKDRRFVSLHCACKAERQRRDEPRAVHIETGHLAGRGRPRRSVGRGFSRGTSNRYCMLDAQILRTASHWEVWIFRCGQPLRCAGSIGSALASDALRQGQDLVDDLLNDTLKQLERNSHLPVCASAGRPDERRPILARSHSCRRTTIPRSRPGARSQKSSALFSMR